jgi:putative chitinase
MPELDLLFCPPLQLPTKPYPEVKRAHLVKMGASKSMAADLEGPLNSAMKFYEINTSARQRMFLANAAVETLNFSALTERTGYTIERIKEVWPSRFDTDAKIETVLHDPANLDKVSEYGVIDPEKLLRSVYGGRMGNAADNNDGFTYRGRGLLHLTGKQGYANRGKSLGQDFVANPGLVAEPYWACFTAADFWFAMKLNGIADGDTEGAFVRTAGGVNVGNTNAASYQINALSDRKKKWNDFKSIFDDRDKEATDNGQALNFCPSTPLGIRAWHPVSTPPFTRRSFLDDLVMPDFGRNMSVARCPRYY